MIRRILERIGILSPPVLTKTDYLVTVYVMSEGTAQGIPRPLQVFKLRMPYTTNPKERWAVAPEDSVAFEVHKIIRYGYKHTLSDGTNVTYAPHTIYRVTSKEISNED